MQEIFTRRKSKYGEVTLKESSRKDHQLSHGFIKGMKFNQSSSQNIDLLINPDLSE